MTKEITFDNRFKNKLKRFIATMLKFYWIMQSLEPLEKQSLHTILDTVCRAMTDKTHPLDEKVQKFLQKKPLPDFRYIQGKAHWKDAPELTAVLRFKLNDTDSNLSI
jgi:hypothetical protein